MGQAGVAQLVERERAARHPAGVPLEHLRRPPVRQPGPARRRVEAELGTRLFERVPTGVQLNLQGELVASAARDLTARYPQLLAELEARLNPDTGIARLAVLDSMATSLVWCSGRNRRTRYFATWRPGPPSWRSPRHSPAASSAGSRYDQERLHLVVPPSHRLRCRRRVGLGELADEEFITTPAGFGHRSLVDGLLAEAGVTARISFESADSRRSRVWSRPVSASRWFPSSSPGRPAASASR